ncbi:MAG TPA: cadmium-translocating P-type ATPase [Actinobacteria bacterium]|nr:cadmium-translocating P-type ATPase [Actinomycetes bacterium]HEX21287.1 cadmium-translocating P-type ATPase [Actinomycetota bacterium]
MNMSEEHRHQQSDHNQPGHDHHRMMLKDYRLRFYISLFVSIPVLTLSPLIQKYLGFSLRFTADKYVLLALSSFVFFYGGWPFLKGIVSEIKKRQPGMMMLVALAISVAYFYSVAVVFGLEGKYFFWELVTLIDVMLLGHWLEMRSILGASRALEKLAQLMPSEAHLIKEDGEVVNIRIGDLKKGDSVLIKAGEKVPSDGIILKGKGYMDESMLTGESKPVRKNPGDQLIGGSVNGDTVFEIKIRNTGADSYLAKVINLVKEAQAAKSKTQKLADVAAMWLTIVSIAIGVSTFTFWIIYSHDFAFAVERMATVMVIACPHALGLAIPLVVAVSTSLSAKNGLLIRNRTAFENSRKISTVVFDKTGTLTEGKFGVSDITVLDPEMNEKKFIQLAASLERNSEHPIAKGILAKAKELGVAGLTVSNFKVLKGEGVEGKVDDRQIKIVSPGYLKKQGLTTPTQADAGKTATQIFMLEGNNILGSISLADKIRAESFEAIKQLQKIGIKCWMLTGDNKDIAADVSQTLNLDGYFAEVLPHEKQEKVKELQAKGEFVAMTGDGINDAPALAQADVGIAIGSGTDIAAETADIILVNSNPMDVTSLVLFGKATYAKMMQNLFWATGYNVIAIPLAAGVLYGVGIVISPAFGAALMSVSTIIVAINARFLKIKR